MVASVGVPAYDTVQAFPTGGHDAHETLHGQDTPRACLLHPTEAARIELGMLLHHQTLAQGHGGESPLEGWPVIVMEVMADSGGLVIEAESPARQSQPAFEVLEGREGEVLVETTGPEDERSLQ